MTPIPWLSSVITIIKQFVDWLSGLPILGLLLRAGMKGQDESAKDMAASVAFFSFLSLFPLILGLIAIGGFFLDTASVQARLQELIASMLPVSAELVTGNIDSVVRLRGAASIGSLVTLLWSASKMIGALSRGINHALGLEQSHAFYLSRLRYFGLTVAGSLIVFIGIAVTPTLDVLAELEPDFLGDRWHAALELIAGKVAGFTITFVLVGLIYVIIPFKRPTWRAILPGQLVAALMIEIGKNLFGQYYSSVSRYDLVYGSLSSWIVLMLWLYFWSRAILYGSEIISVYQQDRQKQAGEST